MKKIIFFITIFSLNFFLALPALAQSPDRLTLSITPPLIKNNIEPGQTWASSIKVVNNNTEAITIYVRVMDFAGGEETGTVRFINPPADGGEDVYASRWIEINPEPMTIPAQKSVQIPFVVQVPEAANPGGHYAAILAGTQPPTDKTKGAVIRVSSLLASLLLLSISGDIEEKGAIREFSTDKKAYSDPNVHFTVRFENQGNVHIQPQGEIRIYNQFDESKETIAINHNTEFGNVLPEGIRRWEFDWQGEKSLLEMGKYRAELILSYGELVRSVDSRTVYFWVFNLKPLSMIFLSLIIVVALIVLFVRYYIRRAIVRTQEQAGIIMPKQKDRSRSTVVIPKENNVVNLKTSIKQKFVAVNPVNKRSIWRGFKLLVGIMFVFIIIVAGGLSYQYFKKNSDVKVAPVLTGNKTEEKASAGIGDEGPEEISEKEVATSTVVIDQQVISTSSGESKTDNVNKEDLVIRILNGSGLSGQASKAKERLSNNGWNTDSVGNADNFNYQNTVIKYRETVLVEAEQVSKLFSQTVKLEINDDQSEDIIIIVGRDF